MQDFMSNVKLILRTSKGAAMPGTQSALYPARETTYFFRSPTGQVCIDQKITSLEPCIFEISSSRNAFLTWCDFTFFGEHYSFSLIPPPLPVCLGLSSEQVTKRSHVASELLGSSANFIKFCRLSFSKLSCFRD